MNRQDKIHLISLLEEKARRKKYNAINDYKPYPKQIAFHRAGLEFDERALGAGNQLGKCASVSCIIETSKGPMRMGDIWGKDVEVLTWPNKEPRKVTKWIKKEPEECFRITMSDGQWFECPKGHRILSSSGYVFVERLLECASFRPRSNSVFSRLAHALSARRLLGTLRGYLSRCFVDCRLDGGQLLCDQEGVQVFSPLQDDALRYSPLLSCLDVLASKYTNNPLLSIGLLSNLDDVRRTLARCVSFLIPSFSRFSLRMTPNSQALWLSSSFAHPQKTIHEDGLCSFGPYDTPNVEGNHIVSIKSVGVHTLYDMEVEERHNYIAAGLVHHNTLCGSMEAAYHLTGLYPDSWHGVVFEKPVVMWVGGVTGETIRDTTQKLLLGRLQSGDDMMGTGSIPRDKIIDMVKARGTPDLLDHASIRHSSNGVSLVFFKSYASGRAKWQGETIDLLWLDEEPEYDIYSEGRTRTNKGQNGRCIMLTFTPLLGMTTVVNQFYKTPTRVQKLITMSINDVEHYTEEEKENIIAGYEMWERDARIKGIPTLGSGRIFMYPEEDIKEPHISEIPKHWALLNALDFGWDHPQACVQIAWDKDEDVIHVVRGHKARETSPNDMYVRVRAWAEGIQTVWPHDGFQRDKSGKQTKELYVNAGFNMWHEQVSHEEGGNGVEAGILEMQDRFATKRLLIDESLEEFWEEFRLYHRKNGVIVKENDDFIDGVRYAIMMKRFAQTHIDMNPIEAEYVHYSDF